MPYACQQKRKADQDDPDEGSGNAFPPWVVCFGSACLFHQGVSLPDELKMSKKTLKELQRIKKWAASHPGLAGNPAASPPPTVQVHEAVQPRMPAANPAASPPPTMQVEVMGPSVVPPARVPPAQPFDPAVLAKVAQLKNGLRVGV